MSKKISLLEWALWSVVLFWGANYVVGKWGMAGFDPLTFNTLRFVIVTPILFVILFFFEHDISIARKDWFDLALLGLVGIAIYQTLFMSAVKYSTATNASLLLAVSPVFTALFALGTGQEKLGRKGKLGTALALCGVLFVLVFGTNSVNLSFMVWRGDLLGAFASCVWGFYPVLSYRTLKKYSAIKTYTWSALFGTIFLLLIGGRGLFEISWTTIPLASWGSLAFSIGPVTAFGQVVWYYGINKVGVNRVMVYMYAIPVVAVLTALLLLGERIHLLQIFGASVIFFSINMVRKDKISIKDLALEIGLEDN